MRVILHAPAGVSGLAFAKGHGTGNDFVLYADPVGARPLTSAAAAWLCDRRCGIGGDGAIRAGREGDTWFMDYRNADGSLAEMCGNGVRVLAEYLVTLGLAEVPPGGTLTVATRGGVKSVLHVSDGVWSVDMGTVTLGHSHLVRAEGVRGPRQGRFAAVPNPHVVVPVTAEQLDALDLTRPPRLDPPPAGGADEVAHGVNVEFVVVEEAVSGGLGRARLRVHERGVGETLSCGTGVVATAAVLADSWLGAGQPPSAWQITVPGGELTVRLAATGEASLEGPAVIVARGHIA
jgi:diaminopimelate epimerase